LSQKWCQRIFCVLPGTKNLQWSLHWAKDEREGPSRVLIRESLLK
jgi:hypothetical protein